MNTMGCSTVFLAAAALVIGFIPILEWTNLFVALPLALFGIISTGNAARKPSAQSADKAVFWISVAIGATVILRILVV